MPCPNLDAYKGHMPRPKCTRAVLVGAFLMKGMQYLIHTQWASYIKKEIYGLLMHLKKSQHGHIEKNNLESLTNEK